MTDQLLKRYLLGELSSNERRRLEELFFNDAEAFERLLAIEDDLIDDYACGDLSRKQRKRFETHFLVSPERRERLALAEALVASVSKQPDFVAEKQPTAPWWESILDFLKFQNPTLRFAMVAASLVFLVYGMRETVENNRLRREYDQLQQQNDQLQKEKESAKQEMSQMLAHDEQVQKELQQRAQREQELTNLLDPPPQLWKAAARTRSGRQPMHDLSVTRNARWVKLQLEFDKATTFKIYRAVLKTYSGGNEIWSQSRLSAQSTNKANVVVVTLPASIFGQAEETVQEYQLTLSGADVEKDYEPVEVYDFRVVKK
jgi:hypothetical protein